MRGYDAARLAPDDITPIIDIIHDDNRCAGSVGEARICPAWYEDIGLRIDNAR